MLNAKNQVKTLLASRAMTMTKLADEMSKKSKKTYCLKTLSAKLARNALRYEEMLLICDILNYEISFLSK
jgi:hypothetical protein